MRLVVVVKYFPPLERVSGIVGFLSVLCRELARHVDVVVVTHRPRGDDRKEVMRDGYRIVRIGGSFPVGAGAWVRSADADAVLFVSGIHETRFAAPYLGVFLGVSGSAERCSILQATHLDGPPTRAMQFVFGRARSVIAASTTIAESFREAFEWTVPVVEPAVDLHDVPDRAPGTRTVGFVNHLNRVKGADTAAAIAEDLLRSHDELRVVFAGTGELTEHIRDRFAGDERVRVDGFLEDEERLSVIAACDVMILPFRTSVSVLGVSQTVLEVMAAGGVVAGTPTPAITPALVDGRNGIVAPADELGAAIDEALRTPGRLEELGRTARTDAENLWDVRCRAASLLELLAVD